MSHSIASAQSSADLLRSLGQSERQALLEQVGLGQDQSSSGSAVRREEASRPDRGAGATLAGANANLPPDFRLLRGESLLIEIDFLQDRQIPQPQVAGTVTAPQVIKAPEYRAEEREQLSKLIDAVRHRNPYRLDEDGVLTLPGFRAIQLAGLTVEEANKRLELEPGLDKLGVSLVRLSLRVGTEALKPFGYDLFRDSPSTFAPTTDVPVPADYVIGAGDQLNVLLYGSQNRSLRLEVARDGSVNFPELGPISVSGKTFNAVREEIESRVANQLIGTQASVSMGDTRAIRIFVTGEAELPGAYTVSGLSTITSALYASGGIKTTGSLRNVQLKRRGAVVRTLDLYDLLLRGDTSADASLLPGDVVFIPPVGNTVTIDGEVRRPAIYEINTNTSLEAAIELAGGLTSQADGSKVSVVRVDEQRRRTVLDLPMDSAQARTERMRNGDSLRVGRLRSTLDAGIRIEGHVQQPWSVAYREGLRISEVLTSIDELKPDADLGYVLIRRESQPDRRVSVLSVDLSAALRAPGSAADVPLAARDRITVFDRSADRQRLIDPLLDELRRQATLAESVAIVTVQGRVKAPGDYPLEPDMRIKDLLRAGGSLDDGAYGVSAEILRSDLVGSERRRSIVQVDLAAIRGGAESANLVLQPYDVLLIKEIPDWDKQENVTLRGEVRFPGTYPIRPGETLRAVIERAGGLTELAAPSAAVFTRKELREREAEQIKQLSDRLQRDLAALSIQAGQIAEGAQAARGASSAIGLLENLLKVEPVGRLVINLDRVLTSAAGSTSDIFMRDGDQLVIPKIRQEVTVLGEVQNGTSHLYRSELKRDDYLAFSGGLTRKADRKRIYVVRADGSVVTSGRLTGWGRGDASDVRPGDTIVVPVDTERLPALPLWQAVTGIIYNSAVALAAIRNL